MTDTNGVYAALVRHLNGFARIDSAKAALEWDMETVMPPAGNDRRSETLAYLAGIRHEKATSSAYEAVLHDAVALADAGAFAPGSPELADVRLAAKAFERARKLPAEFVTESSALYASSHHVWAEARKASDWKAFLPNFSRIVAMKREEARLVGFADSPYDALLEEYEPGMTAQEASRLLGGLAAPLSRLVRRIAGSSVRLEPDWGRIAADAATQAAFNRRIAEKIGFDFAAGRLDPSAHPFTMRVHPGDVRITTRYDEKDLLYALMSTIHEVGHGLYEQGLPADRYGTPSGEAPSLGIHESQSRLWENMVARSPAFCAFLHDQLAYAGIVPPPVEAIVQALNAVAPSFIRTEADEVTYNLHICLRFDLERALMEGRLEPSDVPAAWDAKMREYLGLAVTDDANGALQDVHWSAGLFGYFPTYALGNVYAAQLYDAASRQLPTLEHDVRAGGFRPLLEWLRREVHRHGSAAKAADIVASASGGAPDARFFIEYLERKYGGIYSL